MGVTNYLLIGMILQVGGGSWQLAADVDLTVTPPTPNRRLEWGTEVGNDEESIPDFSIYIEWGNMKGQKSISRPRQFFGIRLQTLSFSSISCCFFLPSIYSMQGLQIQHFAHLDLPDSEGMLKNRLEKTKILTVWEAFPSSDAFNHNQAFQPPWHEVVAKQCSQTNMKMAPVDI